MVLCSPTGMFSVSVGRPMASADGTITIAIQVHIGATAPMALAVEGHPSPSRALPSPPTRRNHPHSPEDFYANTRRT